MTIVSFRAAADEDVTLEVYPADSDAMVGSAESQEATNRSGTYTATLPNGLAAGVLWHLLARADDGSNVGDQWLILESVTSESDMSTVTALDSPPATTGNSSDVNVATIEGEDATAVLSALCNPLAITGLRLAQKQHADGSALVIVQGDDYRIDQGTALTISVDDAEGTLHAQLDAADELKVGIGRMSCADQLTGTITATHALGITTLALEFTAANTAGIRSGEYEFHLQATQDGHKSTFASGCASVVADRAI